MDDRRALFIMMLGDTCSAARLAHLEIEVRLLDGARARGVPGEPGTDDAQAIDHTGYTPPVMVGGQCVLLHEVMSFEVFAHRGGGS